MIFDEVGLEITLWSLVPRLKLGEVLGPPVRLPRIDQTSIRISGGGLGDHLCNITRKLAG